MINESKLIIKDKNKNIEYDILFTFEKDNKTYIVYSDNEIDEDGFIKTYAAIYENNEGEEYLINIEDDEDFEIIEDMLNKLDGSNEENEEKGK